jgi:hypothetical protein
VYLAREHPAALASAFIVAHAGQFRLTVADKMLAIDVNSDRSAVQLPASRPAWAPLSI